MKVLMRRETEARGVYFCDCQPWEIERVLSELQRGGGVHLPGLDPIQELSFQFIQSPDFAGAEIVVHDEEASA